MYNFKYSSSTLIHLIIVSIIPFLIWGPFIPDLILSITVLFFLFYLFKNNELHFFKNIPLIIFFTFCISCILISLFVAEDVMLSLLYEGVVVLPIHDSFIVRYGYEPSLKAQMKSSFKKIIKAIINVKATGSLLPEHFNKNIDVLSESKKHNIIAGKDTWELLIDTSNSIHEKYLASWSKYQ